MATKTKKQPKADRVQGIRYEGHGMFRVQYTVPHGLTTMREEDRAGEVVYQDSDIQVYSLESKKENHVNGECHIPYHARALVIDGRPAFCFHQYTQLYREGGLRDVDHCGTEHWGNDCSPTAVGDYWYVWFMGASSFSDCFMRIGPRSQAALTAIGVKPTGSKTFVAETFARHLEGAKSESEYIDLP